MGLSAWIKKIFSGRQKASGSQNWMLDSGGLGRYRLDDEGWLIPADGDEADVVLNAIDRVASEIAKIDVRSVVVKPDSVKVQNDDLTRLFRYGPNPLQTTSDFLCAAAWLRLRYCNVFIYPQYDLVRDVYGQPVKKYKAFWLLTPTDFEVGTDESGQVWEIKFQYPDGGTYILPYAELLHLKWRRGTNLFKGGGDDAGRVNETDMLRSAAALRATIEGLPKSIAASMQVRGVYNAKSLLDSTRQAEQRANFEQHVLDSKSGMIVTDLAGEFTPVNLQAPQISDSLAAFMRSGVSQRYGVSDAVLAGDYTSTQHSAFYQTAIEGFILDFEQEASRKLFSQREQDVGHRIKGYYNTLLYLATGEKQEMARLAFNVGLMSINDVRAMWGLPPIADGDRYLQSLNYVDTQIANQYQMAGAQGTGDLEPEDVPDASGDAGGDSGTGEARGGTPQRAFPTIPRS